MSWGFFISSCDMLEGRMIDRYKNIVWDWNGTLLDDAMLAVDVMNSILRDRSMSLLNIDNYRENFGFPVQDYYRRLGFDFTREPFSDLARLFVHFYNQRRAECLLQPGALELLKRLDHDGYMQFLLSASHEEDLLSTVNEHGIAAYFTCLAGLGDRHASGKTARGQEMLQAQKIRAVDCLLIGDSLHDAEVAENLGCACVLLSCGHQSRQRLERSGYPVFDSLFELEQLLHPRST